MSSYTKAQVDQMFSELRNDISQSFTSLHEDLTEQSAQQYSALSAMLEQGDKELPMLLKSASSAWETSAVRLRDRIEQLEVSMARLTKPNAL